MLERLYIIGPVTGIEDDNRPAFLKAQKALRRAGYDVDIPHDFIPSGTPHEEAMIVSIGKLTDRHYHVDGSFGRWKPRYHGVATLPGWEDSQGALCEHLVAQECGIPCKTVEDWLEKAR